MAIATKLFRWPRLVLSKSLTSTNEGWAQAEVTAHEIAEVGRLKVIEWDEKPPFGIYMRMKVGVPRRYECERIREWWINIRPSNFEGPHAKVPSRQERRTIEFLFVGNTSGRYRNDPSSYLTIKPEV